jgi:hypothetical protein
MPGKPGMNKGRMGGRRDNAGRPRTLWQARQGDTFVVERQTIGALDPFHRPEMWQVLSVTANEVEFQAGDDIIVLRRPDDEEGEEDGMLGQIISKIGGARNWSDIYGNFSADESETLAALNEMYPGDDNAELARQISEGIRRYGEDGPHPRSDW